MAYEVSTPLASRSLRDTQCTHFARLRPHYVEHLDKDATYRDYFSLST